MSPLETAFAAWLAFHSNLGVDMEQFLQPPATSEEIAEVESAIGFSLPPDLRELYTIANGQLDFHELRSVAADQQEYQESWAPFFGNFTFLPLDKALENYNFWLEIYDSNRVIREKYNNANPDKKVLPVEWEVRDGDLVDPLGWNPKWFVFAKSHADYYSVDLSPPRGGVPGQVVLHGADEHVLQVVAHSVTDMMLQASQELDPADQQRFEWVKADDTVSVPQVYFNIDPRWQPVDPQVSAQNESIPPAYKEWLQHKGQVRDVFLQEYRSWLGYQVFPTALDNRALDSIMHWTEMNLLHSIHMNPPHNVITEWRDYLISKGEKVSGWLTRDSDEQTVQTEGELLNKELVDYIFRLTATISKTERLHSSMLPIPSGEAIDLYHKFRVEKGEWTSANVEQVQNVIAQVEDIFNQRTRDVDESRITISENSFNISQASGELSICFGTFDAETYKSGEECFSVDLSALYQ